MPSREERFWRKVVQSDGCWEWRGARKSGIYNYGVLKSGPERPGQAEMAHRISWELHNGAIPSGMVICHHCDNPPCVRPDHLFMGTPADNNHDRDRKGRHRTKRRLTPFMVREIRRRRTNGELMRVLAVDYGTSTGHISSIVSRRWWRGLE